MGDVAIAQQLQKFREVALRRLLDDAALRSRLAAAARARVGDYDWTRVAEQLRAVYRSVARPDQGAEDRALARATFALSVHREAGVPGSLLEHPGGLTFELAPAWNGLTVSTALRIPLRLPRGATIAHDADVAAHRDGAPVALVDVLRDDATHDAVKALAFDAFHLKRRDPAPWALLILVRTSAPRIDRDVAESLADPYDQVFAIDHDDVGTPSKYAACRADFTGRRTPARASS